MGPRPHPETVRFFPFFLKGFIIETILFRMTKKIFFDGLTSGLRYRITLHRSIMALLSAKPKMALTASRDPIGDNGTFFQGLSKVSFFSRYLFLL